MTEGNGNDGGGAGMTEGAEMTEGGGNDGKGPAGLCSFAGKSRSSVSRSHTKRAPSVIPDVGHRESRVFPCRTSPSLVVRHRGSHYSEVMLALSKGYDSLIEPWGKTVLTGFPLKTAGMTERGLRE